MTARSGAPAVPTADAVKAALEAVGVRGIALAMPSTDFGNRCATEWLAAQGFEVVADEGLQPGATAEERANIGRVPARPASRPSGDVRA